MTRLGIRTSVLMICLMCFLTLVLPFCVPTAESKLFLPEPPAPPPSDGADPDDVAVNTARNPGGDLPGEYGFGTELFVVIGGDLFSTGQRVTSQEVPVAGSRDSARWLLLVWILASRIY